jgi:hypothetical protein
MSMTLACEPGMSGSDQQIMFSGTEFGARCWSVPWHFADVNVRAFSVRFQRMNGLGPIGACHFGAGLFLLPHKSNKCLIYADFLRFRGPKFFAGLQDHTALPSATAPLVLRAVIAHETSRRSALRSHRRARSCRVHRIPDPTSVTIAIRPSVRAGMAAISH